MAYTLIDQDEDLNILDVSVVSSSRCHCRHLSARQGPTYFCQMNGMSRVLLGGFCNTLTLPNTLATLLTFGAVIPLTCSSFDAAGSCGHECGICQI